MRSNVSQSNQQLVRDYNHAANMMSVCAGYLEIPDTPQKEDRRAEHSKWYAEHARLGQLLAERAGHV